jgi:hypothetical protein
VKKLTWTITNISDGRVERREGKLPLPEVAAKIGSEFVGVADVDVKGNGSGWDEAALRGRGNLEGSAEKRKRENTETEGDNGKLEEKKADVAANGRTT